MRTPTMSLSLLDEHIERFYLRRGIVSPEQLSLYVFDEIVSVRVMPSEQRTYVEEYGLFHAIWLESGLSLPERRVRIAHEIGHILLHSGNQMWMAHDSRIKQEHQAECFALYALVPTYLLLPCLRDLPENPQGACAELAEIFGVPEWFMADRLKRLEADRRG